MNNKIDSKLILNRIKRRYNLSRNIELASFLGVNPTTLSGWMGDRGIANWPLIFEKCEGVSLDWLIRGDYSQYENVTLEDPRNIYQCPNCKEKDERIKELTKDKERLWQMLELVNQNQKSAAG